MKYVEILAKKDGETITHGVLYFGQTIEGALKMLKEEFPEMLTEKWHIVSATLKS